MKNSQLLVIIVTIVLSAGVLLWVLAPPERIASITERFVDKSPQQLCLDYVNERVALKDPGSAELVSFTESGSDVSIRFKAKNSFGAYITDVYECNVVGDSVITSARQRDKQMRAWDNAVTSHV